MDMFGNMNKKGSIMNDIDRLLEYVRKTNPGMDGQKLIERLCENQNSALSLIAIFKNSCVNNE